MGPLRAGVCRVDITPPLGGDAIGTAGPEPPGPGFDDGSRRVALVATDLLWMPPHVAEAVLLNASHNHSAPVLLEPDSLRAAVRTEGLDGYAAALPDGLAGAVYAANVRRQPAAIGAGIGWAPGISVNRGPAAVGRRHRE